MNYIFIHIYIYIEIPPYTSNTLRFSHEMGGFKKGYGTMHNSNSGWWFGTFFPYWEKSSQLTNMFQRG